MSCSVLRQSFVNDADYNVCIAINGKRKFCPFYRKWIDMINRCYSTKYQERMPSYAGAYVCEEWKKFSVFKSWMEKQDYQGKHLDKDIIFTGNKLYSPESCVFVPPALNLFVTDRERCRGDLPIGVYERKSNGKYRAQCSNPFSGKREMLGTFDDPQEAHDAWRKRKHQISCEWAKIVGDERLKIALLKRYA